MISVLGRTRRSRSCEQEADPDRASPIPVSGRRVGRRVESFRRSGCRASSCAVGTRHLSLELWTRSVVRCLENRSPSPLRLAAAAKVVSPVPASDRLSEYAIKGFHAAARECGLAPEHVRARRLARQVRPAVASGETRADRVLIVTPRNWTAHVQWEAMIGQALRVRGADVRFLGCGGGLEICDRANTWEAPPMPCRTCAGYVRRSIDAHGFSLDELSEHWSIDSWPELDAMHFDELRDVEYRNLPLGQLVEIPVKWFLMRATLDDDPLAPVTYRRFLRSGRRIVDAISKALAETNPDVVLLCNGLFLFEAIAFALALRAGIDVVTYERGLIKETLVFRRNAPACLLDMGSSWERWADLPLTPTEESKLDEYLRERELGRKTIDRFWQDADFSEHKRSSRGRLVVAFPNLTWDSAVIGQGRAFDDLGSWLLATIDMFAGRPNDELVIRVHPAEAKLPGKQTREPIEAFVKSRRPSLSPNIRLIAATDSTSSYPLMRASDAVLVFSSTTGLEAAVRGKPVVVAGQTHYRGKGFTVDVSTPDEYLTALEKTLADPASFSTDVEQARRYAYALFFRFPMQSPGVEEHVPGLARLTARSLDELRPGANRDLDRICRGILGTDDFDEAPTGDADVEPST